MDKNSNLNLKNILLASEDIRAEQDMPFLEHRVQNGDMPYNIQEFQISRQLTDKQIAGDLKEGTLSSYLLKLINDPKSLHTWDEKDFEKRKKSKQKAK